MMLLYSNFLTAYLILAFGKFVHRFTVSYFPWRCSILFQLFLCRSLFIMCRGSHPIKWLPVSHLSKPSFITQSHNDRLHLSSFFPWCQVISFDSYKSSNECISYFVGSYELTASTLATISIVALCRHVLFITHNLAPFIF